MFFLNGDFNARTGKYADFIDADDFLSNLFEFDDSLLEFYNSSNLFNDLPNIARERTSQDGICNKEGKALLDMCKTNNLLILNGRCGSDKNTGALTFRDRSLIDY